MHTILEVVNCYHFANIPFDAILEIVNCYHFANISFDIIVRTLNNGCNKIEQFVRYSINIESITLQCKLDVVVIDDNSYHIHNFKVSSYLSKHIELSGIHTPHRLNQPTPYMSLV